MSRFKIKRIMPVEVQLQRWLAGDPVHNGASRSEGECCPDFSCCNPGMLWPVERRKAYVEADEKVRHQMCMRALGELMDYHEKRKVRIIG